MFLEFQLTETMQTFCTVTTHTCYIWTCSSSAQEPSSGCLKVNFSLLTLLSTSSLLLCLSLVARAANCCSRAGLGGLAMSRKYWKACEMVQGGIRLSLVQLLITPGGREDEEEEEKAEEGDTLILKVPHIYS